MEKSLCISNVFGLPQKRVQLLCRICNKPFVDFNCWCEKGCEFGFIRKCSCDSPHGKHQHLIDEMVLNEQVSSFMNEFFLRIDFKDKTSRQVEQSYLKRFSTIQLLRENEGLSSLNHGFSTNNSYYLFTTSLIKRHDSVFNLKSLQFHYIFDVSSGIHDFLNNYLNIEIIEINNNDSRPKTNRIVCLTYKCGTIFRTRGDSTINDKQFSLLNQAKYNDYFSIYYKSEASSEINVILIDLANNKGHVMSETSHIGEIVDSLRHNEIVVDRQSITIRDFEGNFELKTNVLLFKMFMTCYLHVPVFGSRWMIRSPDKNVNDYIFFETEQKTTFEYVKLSIEPLVKIDSVFNLFRLSFQGNDKELLLPFISSLLALITKLENLSFAPEYKELFEVEAEFKRRIQEDKFEVDRYVKSFLSFRICKKKAFITAANSFSGQINTNDNSFNNNYPSNLPVNYRPLVVNCPIRKQIGSLMKIHFSMILKYAMFFDSLSLNSVFANDAEIITGGKLYAENEEAVVIDFGLIGKETTTEKLKGTTIFCHPEHTRLINERATDLFELLNIRIGNNYVLTWNMKTKMLLIDYPLEGIVKGLERLGDYPRRKAHKTHSEKLTPIDALANNIILKYTDTPCKKLIVFSSDIFNKRFNLHEKAMIDKNQLLFTLREYCNEILDDDNTATLLSQHLWDYNRKERLDTLSVVNPEIHLDLLQYLFNARILYFVYDQKDNEYVFREPRYNGWFAINNRYDRVLFMFKAKNENYYISTFELEMNGYTESVVSFTIPLTEKIVSSYREISISNDTTDNRLTIEVSALVDVNPKEIKCQLIDSYGKSVGFLLRNGSERRFPPRAPIMEPQQNHIHVLYGKTNYFIPKPTKLTDADYACRFTHSLVNRQDVINRSEYERQTRQNISVLSKTILKYCLLSNETDLDSIIRERTTELQHFTNDRIYKLVVIPCSDLFSFSSFLEENYGSVFSEKCFWVVNAPKWRLFIKNELFCMFNRPTEFYSEFLAMNLDLSMIQQFENEILNEDYLNHKRLISSVKGDLISSPTIKHCEFITPELILAEKILVVKIVVDNVSENYLVVDNSNGEKIEVGCFICDLWANTRRIANYNEQRTLRICYDSFKIGNDGKITLAYCTQQVHSRKPVKILHYTSGLNVKHNRYASLLKI
jgi:hypothetical protein